MVPSFFVLSCVPSSFGFAAVFPLRPDGPRVVIARLSVAADARVLSFSAPAFALSSFCSWIAVSSFFAPLVIEGVALWFGIYRALCAAVLFVFVIAARDDFIPGTPAGFYTVFWVFGYAAASLFRISGCEDLAFDMGMKSTTCTSGPSTRCNSLISSGTSSILLPFSTTPVTFNYLVSIPIFLSPFNVSLSSSLGFEILIVGASPSAKSLFA